MSRIPKKLHYIFGMASDFGGKPWSLLHHVCLKSAVERIKPDQIFFYYEFEPSGAWWEASRNLVTPVKVEAPREIFGKPLRHVAHRADVLRLQKLIEQGGIYLDADVFVHRDFEDLLDNSVVLGEEGINGEHGMANAVMLAEPNAPFLRRWLDEYRSFRSKGEDDFWSEHSVKVPQLLARRYPDELTVLPYTAFFWPLWTEEHLRWIFGSREPIPLEKSYCTHLWEALSWHYVDGLTPGEVRATETNFHRWARPLLLPLADEYGSLSLAERLHRLRWKAKRKSRQLKKDLRWRGARLQDFAKRRLPGLSRR